MSLVSVFSYLAIHHDGEVFLCKDILDLDHLVSLPRQLSPSAGLIAVLFNGGNQASIHQQLHSAEASAPDLGHLYPLIFDHDFRPIHQLRGNRLE